MKPCGPGFDRVDVEAVGRDDRDRDEEEGCQPAERQPEQGRACSGRAAAACAEVLARRRRPRSSSTIASGARQEAFTSSHMRA